MKKYLRLTSMLLAILAALSFSLLSCGDSGTSEGEEARVLDHITVTLWSVTGTMGYVNTQVDNVWDTAGISNYDYYDEANPLKTDEDFVTDKRKISAEPGDNPRSFWIVPTADTVVYLHANAFGVDSNGDEYEIPLENQSVDWSSNPEVAFTPQVNGRIRVVFTPNSVGTYTFTATSKANASLVSQITLRVPNVRTTDDTTIGADGLTPFGRWGYNTAMPVHTVISRERLDIASGNVLGIQPHYFPVCANTYTQFTGQASANTTVDTLLTAATPQNIVTVTAGALGEGNVTVATTLNTVPADWYSANFIDNATQTAVNDTTLVKVYDGTKLARFSDALNLGLLQDGLDATGSWAAGLAANDDIEDMEWVTGYYSAITKLVDKKADFVFYLDPAVPDPTTGLGQVDVGNAYDGVAIEWSIINNKNYERVQKGIWTEGTVTINLIEQTPQVTFDSNETEYKDVNRGEDGEDAFSSEELFDGTGSTVAPLNPGKLLVIPFGATPNVDILKLSFDLSKSTNVALGDDPYVVIHSFNLIATTMPGWVDLMTDADAEYDSAPQISDTVLLTTAGNNDSKSEKILDWVMENYRQSKLVLHFSGAPGAIAGTVTLSGEYGDNGVGFTIPMDVKKDEDYLALDLDQLHTDIVAKINEQRKANDQTTVAPYNLPWVEIVDLQFVTDGGVGLFYIDAIYVDVMDEGYSQKAGASDIDSSTF